MTDSEIRVIAPDNIRANWAALEAMFAEALADDPGGMQAGEVLSWAVDGKVLIFLADQGRIVMALGFIDTAKGKVAELLALTGTGFIKQAAELWPVIERVCREQECSRVLLHGRPGWRRILDKLGFVVAQTTLAKELT